jgi:hypothetical protein
MATPHSTSNAHCAHPPALFRTVVAAAALLQAALSAAALLSHETPVPARLPLRHVGAPGLVGARPHAQPPVIAVRNLPWWGFHPASAAGGGRSLTVGGNSSLGYFEASIAVLVSNENSLSDDVLDGACAVKSPTAAVAAAFLLLAVRAPHVRNGYECGHNVHTRSVHTPGPR